MYLDIFCGVTLIVFGVYGYLSGALGQVLGIAFVLVGYMASSLFGPAVGADMAAWLGWPARVVELMATGVVFFAVAVLGGWLAKVVLTKIVRSSEALSAGDRFVGSCVGLLKGFVLLALILFVLLRYLPSLSASHPGYAKQVETSYAAKVAQSVDLAGLANPDSIEALHKLWKDMRQALPAVDAEEAVKKAREAAGEAASGDAPAAAGAVLDKAGAAADKARERMEQAVDKAKDARGAKPNPPPRQGKDLRAERLLSNPRIKSALTDPELQKALEKGDLFTLLASPKVQALLKDGTLMQELENYAKQ